FRFPIKRASLISAWFQHLMSARWQYTAMLRPPAMISPMVPTCFGPSITGDARPAASDSSSCSNVQLFHPLPRNAEYSGRVPVSRAAERSAALGGAAYRHGTRRGDRQGRRTSFRTDALGLDPILVEGHEDRLHHVQLAERGI